MIVDAPAVPYYDLERRLRPDREAIKQIVREVAASGEFILKRRVAEFEQALAAEAGAGHAIAVASGTGALLIALVALGAGPGQEVITPAFSFHSSASQIALLGARPVLADVTEADALLDPECVSEAATERTRGVMPTHLFCAMADMPALAQQASEKGWWVLEDSAIALGMSCEGRRAGTWGDAGVFSFHPVKPLAGVTDGGAVITDDAGLATRCRMLRNHGQDGVHRFVHQSVGFNQRMDEINAAVLRMRLGRFAAARRRRAALASRYQAALRDLAPELRLPPLRPGRQTHYTYVVRSARRDDLERHLAADGIETIVYYPEPLHLQPAFAWLGHRAGDFPRAERASRESLALPLYPEMPDSHLDRVIESVLTFHGR